MAKCCSAYKGLQRHHPRKGKPVARLGRKTKGRNAAQFPERLIELHLDEIQLLVAVAWSPKGCWLPSDIVHLSRIGRTRNFRANARFDFANSNVLVGLYDSASRPIP